MASDGGAEGTPRRGWLGRIVALLAVLAVLAAAVAGGGYAALRYAATMPGPAAADGVAETVVLYPRGTGLSAIAADLEAKGLVPDARLFKAVAYLERAQGRLKAGEYAIPSGASMAAIIAQLAEGRSIQHRLTVAEGLTTAMILRLVRDHPVLVGDLPPPPPEGALLPETYLFTRGTTRAELVERMVRDKRELVDALWDRRKDGLPIKTKEEAITLASIVEKETGVADERPRVAAVFVNRLRLGMRLQSDPTIIYGISGGEPLGRGIRQSELDRITPYNTYQIDGLPPTPIANPGRAALEAVLNPPETDELFFVSDGTGGHAFARTLEEHNRNVANWRRIERERASQGPSQGQ